MRYLEFTILVAVVFLHALPVHYAAKSVDVGASESRERLSVLRVLQEGAAYPTDGEQLLAEFGVVQLQDEDAQGLGAEDMDFDRVDWRQRGECIAASGAACLCWQSGLMDASSIGNQQLPGGAAWAA